MNGRDVQRERLLFAAAAALTALWILAHRISYYEGIAVLEILAFACWVMLAEAHLRAWWTDRRRGRS